LHYVDIIVEAADGIATITLNRPDTLNAFANQMRQELAAALRGLGERDDVHVIVITGAGKGFCAGADVTFTKKLVDSRDEDGLRALVGAGRDVVIAVREAPQPVIAAVNGPAAGAGASLALACDLRIGSDRASFGLTFTRVGLHPDWGGTFFLPRLVGTAASAEMIFSGSMVKAEEAHRLGIFNRVVPHDELANETELLARSLAAKPQLTLRLAKQAINRSLAAGLEEMLAFEEEAQIRCAFSEDGAEGLTAFVEKREPRFGKK
jgi:2-(1,2-epoxy-1,2-dihydrophenyl)acetyl-CoA isomerase